MPHTLQDFFAAATQKAADDLAAAFLRLPEDKRGWSPDEKSRTAQDQVAECAVLNGYTASLIQTRTWHKDRFDTFLAEKAEAAAQDWETLQARLQESAGRIATAVAAVPDEALADEIEIPWQTMTLAEVLAYPYWNMTYHQGQINYLASMLGCLP